MFQENPQAIVIMAMLLQEERLRNKKNRVPGPPRVDWQSDLARWGRRLAAGLGALLVTMGQRLQATPGESGPGM